MQLSFHHYQKTSTLISTLVEAPNLKLYNIIGSWLWQDFKEGAKIDLTSFHQPMQRLEGNMRSCPTRLLTLAVLLVLLFTIPFASFAQRIPVELIHQGEDSIGQRIAYQVREMIQNSATMVPYSGNVPGWFRVRLMTMDIGEQKNNLSCFSTILVMCNKDAKEKIPIEYYMTSWIGNGGSARVRDIAESIVAGVSKELEAMRGK
jgi:hypothetical protein